MRYEDLRKLFEEAVERTLIMAQELVEEELPINFSFLLASSTEANRLEDIEGILTTLYQSGAFPRIVDLSVCGIRENETVLWVRPSAHPLTSDLEQTWNQPPGAGPFKALGLSLPTYLWERERPFNLSDLKEAFLVMKAEGSLR